MGKHKKDESCILSIVTKILLIVGGFVVANWIGGLSLGFFNMKKLEKHKNKSNLVHTTMMGNKKVKITPNIENGLLSCLSSRVDFDVAMPENKEMNLELTSICSKVKVFLPIGVNVVLKEEGTLLKTVDQFTDQGEEDKPVIHITVKGFASEVVLARYMKYTF